MINECAIIKYSKLSSTFGFIKNNPWLDYGNIRFILNRLYI